MALHSLDADEASLLAYLDRAVDMIGTPLYDVRHALRLATERGKHRTCVNLLCRLGEECMSLRSACIFLRALQGHVIM